MAEPTISMVIFNSYVSLSEGTYNYVSMIYEYNIWLVVWNMFLFFHTYIYIYIYNIIYWECHHPN